MKESDVAKLLDMKSTVTCLEDAFREQSEKRAVQPERQIIQPTNNPTALVRIMAASVEKIKATGLKVLLGIPAKRKPHSTYFATLLFDPEDAHLLAIISAGRLTQLRTGGASAIATKHLANPHPTTIGIAGAGVQGFGQLEAIASITQLEGGCIFDIDQVRARAFANDARTKLNVELTPTSKVDDLYKVDVICTATTATKPILFGNKLKPGVHINAVGSNAPNRQEIHESVFLRSKVYVDKREQVLKEAGDLAIPIKGGLYKPENLAGELCDVLTGKIKGRTSNSDLTVFKSVGIALEDIAVARAAYDNAIKRKIGTEIEF
ncbi:MAG TPA: ornithine cyclodeaminase family protein [Candidatus Bathyarchaeia archaeon]|nr:ornithine cyclodeaminase family protein [Candidatus Bathyarchaeia archaeon]